MGNVDSAQVGLVDESGAPINPAIKELQLAQAGLVLDAYDYISVAYPTATQEAYTFKTGGSNGFTVALVTVNYSDSTKSNLTEAFRS